MAAPEGNNYAMKFETPEARKELCRRFCEHVEGGLSKECFPDCDPQTFNRYVKDFPEDFDTALIEQAFRKGQCFWEQTGKEGTLGQIKGFNALSWKFNLQNRFDWRDKRDDKITQKVDAAQELLNVLKE